MSNNSIKPYLLTATTIGALGGALHGVRNLPEESISMIEKMGPNTYETMKNYRASFNMINAMDSFQKGLINEKELNTIAEITETLQETARREKQILRIQNTPFNQRTKSLKEAIKEANAMRPKMYKSLFKLTGDFQAKLTDLKIFDIEKFKKTTDASKPKFVAIIKELSKSAAKGLGKGAAVGAVLGAAAYKLFTPKTKA